MPGWNTKATDIAKEAALEHCIAGACVHVCCQMTWVFTHNQSRCIKSLISFFSFLFPKLNSFKVYFLTITCLRQKNVRVLNVIMPRLSPSAFFFFFYIFQANKLQFGKTSRMHWCGTCIHCKHFCGRAKTKSTVEQSLQPSQLANVLALCCQWKNATANPSHWQQL